jgi:hypothetical protein
MTPMTIEERIKARLEALAETPLPNAAIRTTTAGSIEMVPETTVPFVRVSARSFVTSEPSCKMPIDVVRSWLSECGEMLDGVPWGPQRTPEPHDHTDDVNVQKKGQS